MTVNVAGSSSFVIVHEAVPPGASAPARIAALIRSTISTETRPVLTGLKSAAAMA
jgi:hypothetical protein